MIRGLSKLIAPAVPPCVPAFGQRHIRDVLGHLPFTPRSQLTAPQRVNLVAIEDKVKAMYGQGALSIDDVVVFAVDRADGRAYKQNIAVNKAPTLTTKNRYLMVVSVAGIVNDVVDSEREFHRKLALPERLTLQSFPASVAELLPESKIMFAAGNAYPPVVIAAALQPMLKALSTSGLNLASHPPRGTLRQQLPALASLGKALISPGRIVNRKKTCMAKSKAKAHRRKRRI